MSTSLSAYTYIQSETPTVLADIAKGAPSGVDVNCTPAPTAIITTTYTWFQLGDGCPGGFTFSGTQGGPATCVWTSSRDILSLTWDCVFTVTETVSTVTITTSVSAGDRLTSTAADTRYIVITKTRESTTTATTSIVPPDTTVTLTSTTRPPPKRQVDRAWLLPNRLIPNVGPDANLTSRLLQRGCSLSQILCDGGQCCGSGIGSCIASWSCCSGAFDCVAFSPSEPFEALAQYFVSSSTVTKNIATSRTEILIYSLTTVASTNTALVSKTGSQRTWTVMNLGTSTPTAAPVRSSALSIGAVIGVSISAALSVGLLACLLFFLHQRLRRKKMKQSPVAIKPPQTLGYPGHFPPPRSPAFGATSSAYTEPAPTYSFYEPIKLRDMAVQSDDRPLSLPLLSRDYGSLRGEGSSARLFGRRNNTIGADRQTRTSSRRNMQTAIYQAQHSLPLLPEPNERELLAATRARKLQLETNIETPQAVDQENRRPSFLPALRIPSPLQIQTPTRYSPRRMSIPRKNVGSESSHSTPVIWSGLKEVGSGLACTVKGKDKEAQKPDQTPSAMHAGYHTLLKKLEHEEKSKSSRSSLSTPTRIPANPPPAGANSSLDSRQEAQIPSSETNGNGYPLLPPPAACTNPKPTSPYTPRGSYHDFRPALQVLNTSQPRHSSPAHSLSPLSNTPSGQEMPSPLSPASLPINPSSRTQTPIHTTSPYTPYRPSSLHNATAHPQPQHISQRLSQAFSPQTSPRFSQNFSQQMSPLHADSPTGGQRLSSHQSFLPREQQGQGPPRLRHLGSSNVPIPLGSPGLPMSAASDSRGSGRLDPIREAKPRGAVGDGEEDDQRRERDWERRGSTDGRSRGSSRESGGSRISGGHLFDELPPGMPGFYGA